eukprot:scaffold301221_cov28-Tisochrysis_lutea.AAC.4
MWRRRFGQRGSFRRQRAVSVAHADRDHTPSSALIELRFPLLSRFPRPTAHRLSIRRHVLQKLTRLDGGG